MTPDQAAQIVSSLQFIRLELMSIFGVLVLMLWTLWWKER